jgi:hypothetical protein
MFMGPGYIPYVLAGLIVMLGISVGIGSLIHDGPSLDGWRFRSIILILAAVLIFAFTLEQLGLAIAASVSVFVASAGGSEFRPLEAALFAAGITAFSILLFSTALGMPIRIWPW